VSPRRPNRRPEPGRGAGEWLGFAVVLAVVVVLVAVWGAVRLTGGAVVGNNPPATIVYLFSGTQVWPPTATWALLGFLALGLVAVGVGGWGWWSVWGRTRTWIDAKATSMATGRELKPLYAPAAAAESRQLRAQAAGPGVPLAVAVRSGQMLHASWQYVQLWIMGPRAGKTSCVVVPQICETAGPVFATSNKRDIVDLTRWVRAPMGRLWIFDPQQIVGQGPTWWWNPLTYATDISRATALASVFAASVGAGDKGDAYFEPEGEALLAQYLLAAAVAGETLHTVYAWLNEPDNPAAAAALSAAGEQEVAMAIIGTSRLPEEQRGGVFGTSRKMCRFLTDRHILRWVCSSGPDDARPQLDPEGFVTSTDTVYALSKEGAGTTRALTAALTMAVAEAAERHAEQSPLGRLSPPLLCELDEVANIVRWPQLPDLLSHFGSKGIVVSAFLQSYSQGVEVWGAAGMKKVWSACNVRGVGSGVAEPDFLKDISVLIGDHDVRTTSVSSGGGGGSRSRQVSNRREPILEVAELTAMPAPVGRVSGRAVVFVSGVPAALVRLRHWSARPYADLVGAGRDGSLPPASARLGSARLGSGADAGLARIQT